MSLNSTRKDLRQFGVALGVILGVIGAIHFLKHHTHVYPWFFGFAACMIILGVFLPWLLRPIYAVFIRIAHTIGWFNTRFILILVYCLLIVPIGFLMKIFGRDPLNRKIDKSKESYWIERSVVAATKESLEKQF